MSSTATGVSVPAILPAVTVDNAPVPVSIRHDLEVVAKAVHDDGRAFDKMTRGRGGFVEGRGLQKAADTVRKAASGDTIGEMIPVSLVGGGIIGAVTGLCTGSWAIFGLVGGGLFATGSLALPLAMLATIPLANRFKKNAAEKLVPLSDVAPTLERLKVATGVERALLQATVDSWYEQLKSKRALSPEARVALEAAVAEGSKSSAKADAAVAKRVELLKQLVADLAKTGDVTPDYVATLDSRIQKVPEDERAELARCVVDRLGDRPQSYEGKHAYYDFKAKYGLV